VVAVFLRQIMRGRPLVIYGDGTQTRDFIFVDDLCRGILAAMERGEAGEIIHLGSGVETSINELVEMMRALFPDREIRTVYEEPRPGEILRSYSDISKARRTLAFEPEVELSRGLDVTKRWFEESTVR